MAGDEDGVDHEGPDAELGDRGRHHLDDLGAGQHARLGGVDGEVDGHRRHLGPHQLGGHRFPGLDPERVLRRHRGERRRPPHPVGLEGLEVGGDPCPTARIGPGDGEGNGAASHHECSQPSAGRGRPSRVRSAGSSVQRPIRNPTAEPATGVVNTSS